MRPVKCMNEHFFDADKYAQCPQCGAEMKTVNSSSFSKYENKRAKSSIFGRGRKKKENEAVMVPMSSEQGTFGFFAPSVPDSETEVASSSSSQGTSMSENNSIQQTEARGAVSDTVPQVAFPAVEQLNESDDAFANAKQPVSGKVQPSSAASVVNEIRRVSSNNEGKTVGFFNQSRRQKSDDTDTPAISSSEPVVGWLICVKGVHFGESFSITSGRNSIGRSASNSVCLSKDNTVSREKHAWIVFEPRKKRFLVQPGESSGLTYVGGDDVLQPVELHERDIIELGDTKLMLIPLCGDEFSWEEWMKDANK